MWFYTIGKVFSVLFKPSISRYGVQSFGKWCNFRYKYLRNNRENTLSIAQIARKALAGKEVDDDRSDDEDEGTDRKVKSR